MAALTDLVEEVRGETAPAERFDPRTAGVSEFGNPHNDRREGTGLMSKVAVFGAGSWGTAFSIVLADGGNDVTMWARREEVAEAINERARERRVPPRRRAAAVDHGDPRRREGRAPAPTSSSSRRPRRPSAATSTEWAPYLADDAVLVSLMKGVELGTLNRMSEVIAQVTGAGPERIARDQRPQPGQGDRPPRARRLGRRLRRRGRRARCSRTACHSPAFRPYTSVDVLGCELGGAYKNVVGLAVGMAVGLGFGDNTTASVITRGLAETARLATRLGANPLTLMGLAGLGDLVATCSSPLSRNRTFGEKLGQGMSIEDIFASTRQVAEGAKSCASLRALAERTGVDAPIAQYVDDVVAGRMTAEEMMDATLARDTKAETD